MLSALTQFILNKLSQIIYWKSRISLWGMSHDVIFLEKKCLTFADSAGPDQTRHSVMSELGLRCLLILVGLQIKMD